MTFSILKGEKVDAKIWVPNLYEVESSALFNRGWNTWEQCKRKQLNDN